MHAENGRFRLSEFERQEWVLNAQEGVEISDLKSPKFWTQVAHQLRPYARIEVRAEDGTWVAECLVVACDRTWAKVHVLHEHKLTEVTDDQTRLAEFTVKWRGPHHKWCVLRDDGQVIRSDAQTKDEAVALMMDLKRAVA